ncbi:MAG: DUF2169 domain-containing protein [Gammaproteobacteria bacterium]|nr:DUF2169 domain-containing protein [Gammaproteobacteria bacterium]
METRFPDRPDIKGLFILGYIRQSGAVQQVGSVILRRGYSLAGGALTPTTAGADLVLTDRLRYFRDTGSEITDPADFGDAARVNVEQEGDLVPFKPQADLIVRGAYSTGQHCAVDINGVRRLQRTDALRDLNMFGWAPKVQGGRRTDGGTWSDNPAHYPPQWPPSAPVFSPLPADFSNRFYNGHSRQYQMGGFLPLNQWQPGTQIDIRRDLAGAPQVHSFTLGNDALRARLYHYCGHGPDDEHHWCGNDLPLVCDTLIVEPAQNRAQRIWRGHFDLATRPLDTYRRLTVSLSD